jgi:PDZ domain-containing protein
MALLGTAAIAGAVGAAVVRVPYYALSPGSVRVTDPLIRVGDRPDPDAGSIAFATVAVDGRLDLWQVLAGWLDGSVEVVPEERVLRGRTPEGSVEHNQVLMSGSKEQAVGAALGRLGLARPVGAEVRAVAGGTPAESVLRVGDVVVAVDGSAVTGAADLIDAVRASQPGAVLVLSVRPVSGGPDEDRSVTPVAGGGDPPSPMLGVTVADAVETSAGVDVDIDSGPVGGPSAGLAFALGIIDLLTRGDLGGGRAVVATGTIGADGRVGPVGGIAQKAVAVRRSGATVFLVPSSLPEDELARARDLAGPVELVPVATLQEALDALADRGGDPVGELLGAG